jgi:hypothetical protein
MMTASSGSDSGPLHLIGQEWVEHGYPLTPDFAEAWPCIIDGVPFNACVGHDDSTGGLAMGVQFDVPPPNSTPDPRPYNPGEFMTSDRYDVPEGSQSDQPDTPPSFTTLDQSVQVYQNPLDPNTATVEGSESVPPGTTTGLPQTQFSVEDGAFLVIPQGDSE